MLLFVGLVLSAIPTFSMLFGGLSQVTEKLQTSEFLEGFLQNFSAGLIFAAVCVDFFPILLSTKCRYSLLFITIGFAVAFIFMNTMEALTSWFTTEKKAADPASIIIETCKKAHSHESSSSSIATSSPPNYNTAQHDYYQVPTNDSLSLPALQNCVNHQDQQAACDHVDTARIYEDEDIQVSHGAISSREHRAHVKTHLERLLYWSQKMGKSAKLLVAKNGRDPKNWPEMEKLGEVIDKDVHRFQYVLDHCRRLVQGSEVIQSLLQNNKGNSGDIESMITGSDWTQAAARQSLSHWSPLETRTELAQAIEGLTQMSEHLIYHLEQETISPMALKEIHSHLDDLDEYLGRVHARVEKTFSPFPRKYKTLSTPDEGSIIPTGLMVPVVMDCMMDGLFIGVALSISWRAAVILAVVNTFEMCFLGVAVAVRVKRCTGSSYAARMMAIICPPFIITLSCLFGTFAGASLIVGSPLSSDSSATSSSSPEYMLAAVSFGIYALLHLSINELLVHGSGHGEKEGLSFLQELALSNGVILGVFVVLVLDELTKALNVSGV